ncbi:hypothetical protein H206_05587 [Candidatus Electrothrix aarhusensis]|uniref:Uncharacterized protein n=1 Tax=Candidatus Electrothrix aarhusensis TaxID=1859131 RepID=A0A3S3RTS3_9BACT|nr:hypothetical protein H206_05587 [Candidatus Electrothrix aarhusensis]
MIREETALFYTRSFLCTCPLPGQAGRFIYNPPD